VLRLTVLSFAFTYAFMQMNMKEVPLKNRMKVLFLCTGNACRSQMAEDWARALKGDVIDAYSAGVEPHGMNPRAVQAMAEAGVDISGHHSKHVDELRDVAFDYVVTVCDHAHESCPLFPGKTKVVHFGFEDPPRLAKDAETEEEAMAHYRRVRDEIRDFVQGIEMSLPVRDEVTR
jgi:arsenate reductase